MARITVGREPVPIIHESEDLDEVCAVISIACPQSRIEYGYMHNATFVLIGLLYTHESPLRILLCPCTPLHLRAGHPVQVDVEFQGVKLMPILRRYATP